MAEYGALAGQIVEYGAGGPQSWRRWRVYVHLRARAGSDGRDNWRNGRCSQLALKNPRILLEGAGLRPDGLKDFIMAARMGEKSRATKETEIRLGQFGRHWRLCLDRYRFPRSYDGAIVASLAD